MSNPEFVRSKQVDGAKEDFMSQDEVNLNKNQ